MPQSTPRLAVLEARGPYEGGGRKTRLSVYLVVFACFSAVLFSGFGAIATLPLAFALGSALVFWRSAGGIDRLSLRIFGFLLYVAVSGLLMGGFGSIRTDGAMAWLAGEGRLFVFFVPFIATAAMLRGRITSRPVTTIKAFRAVIRLVALLTATFLAVERTTGVELFSSHHAVGAISAAVTVFLYLDHVFDKTRTGLYFAILGLITLAASNSRTSLLAVAGALLVFHILRGDTKRVVKLALLSGIPIGALLLVFSGVAERVDRAIDPDTITSMFDNFVESATSPYQLDGGGAVGDIELAGDRNLAIRGHIWGRAVKEAAMSPLIGIGFGRFNDFGRQFLDVGIGEVAVFARYASPSVASAHNTFLHHSAELGLLGVILLVSIFLPIARRCWAASFSRSNSRLVQFWGAVGIVSLISLLFTGITQHAIGAPIYGLTYGVLLVSAYRLAK